MTEEEKELFQQLVIVVQRIVNTDLERGTEKEIISKALKNIESSIQNLKHNGN